MLDMKSFVNIKRKTPPPKYKLTQMFYENVTWDGNIKKKN
jgi:hypothetical protein